jgi:pilus assembly protein Flp/PilA
MHAPIATALLKVRRICRPAAGSRAPLFCYCFFQLSLFTGISNMTNANNLFRNRQGQGLVEYALLIAGVALICAVGVSMFGHKTGDMIDAVAVVLPGAHTDDNGPIAQGQLIEMTAGSAGSPISLDMNAISNATGTARLGQNTEGNSSSGFGGLIVDPSATGS